MVVLELLDRGSLLLDPGVIAEVENPVAVGVETFEEVIFLARSQEMLSVDLGGGQLAEAIGPATLDGAWRVRLAVHGRTIGGDCED